MKYLKTFEGRFRGLDKQQIEDNIEGKVRLGLPQISGEILDMLKLGMMLVINL